MEPEKEPKLGVHKMRIKKRKCCEAYLQLYMLSRICKEEISMQTWRKQKRNSRPAGLAAAGPAVDALAAWMRGFLDPQEFPGVP